MFFAANLYGSEILESVYHTLPIESSKRLKVTAKFLDVAENTLNRWINGKANPPRAVVYALWHESHVGRAVTAAHSEESARLYRRLAEGQQSEIERLRNTIATLNSELERAKLDSAAPHAMNEPFYKRG